MLNYRERRRIVEEEELRQKQSNNINRKIAFLNQPFVLWLLSALFISAVGMYVNAADKCHATSTQIDSTMKLLLTEIDGRLHKIQDLDTSQLSSKAKVSEAVREILDGKVGYQIPTYRDETLHAVLYQYNDLARLVVLSAFGQTAVTMVKNMQETDEEKALDKHFGVAGDLTLDLEADGFFAKENLTELLMSSMDVKTDKSKNGLLVDIIKVIQMRNLVEGLQPEKGCSFANIILNMW
jgi:hypothetical protein